MDSSGRDFNRIRFLNTYIDSLTFQEAREAVDELIKRGGWHYVVTPNSDIIVKMQKDRELKEICDCADLILTDGQMLVKLSHFLGNPIKERVCMTDFIWDVLELAEEREYSVFFLGGREETLERAVGRIVSRYPKLRVAGHYSPPYGFEEDEAALTEVNERIGGCKPDILIAFLGCPKQEKFIFRNRKYYQAALSIPMGGCVDFIAGNVKRAPVWMQKSGFEWFYRFLQEPRRMFRRYFIEDVRIFGLAIRCKWRKSSVK